ncbi:MAG TPA: SufD family Fe-S cluster assembly protein, partial [Archaeoglobus profundus]|nr:SufD family Fe-S cluster assembly protein [Archaeoglobus profundus]
VKKNAKLTFTMIHNWTENIEVIPRTGIIVEDGGVFISNYVLLSPVKLIQTYPTAYLHENARAVFSNIVVAFKNSTIDLGNKVVLSGKGSSAEVISRAISKGGVVIARGQIIAEVPDVRGHLECRGLILNDGIIRAIPELEARCSNVELSHEAAIGKIAEEEIFYLMARGMSRDEAMSTVIRGFMEVEMKDLPPALKVEVDKAIKLIGKNLL